MEGLLRGLNALQKQAVTSSACGRLQIIAGPGTGKTTVLVSRVAYLILVANIPPEQLIVTTFTKKAAKEMVERLEPVMKASGIDISKLLIGTFHSICYRIIRRYGSKMGMNNFTIADERDSGQILKDSLKDLTAEEVRFLDGLPDEETGDLKSQKKGTEKYHGYNPSSFKKQVSKLKSLGLSVVDYEKTSEHNRAVLLVYQKYQNKLQRELLLDFDDCLLQCWWLITKKPVLNFVKHVLVDEFQDTNELQLQLMYEFAKGHPQDTQFQNNVTIVGDPDQSIYAFREAQVANFKKMESFYKQKLQLSFQKISLNENYRSTKDILSISETIMNQQKDRVKKDLQSQHQISFKPVHSILESTVQEAKWLAYNIVYLKSLPNSDFKYSDFAILVRSAFQTRVIEKELLVQRIPYVMVRGKAFWERAEVVAIIDYLKIIVSPFDRMAFLRTLATPKKGVGEKTLQKINDYLSSCDYKETGISGHVRKMISDTSVVSSKTATVLRSHLSFIYTFREQVRDIQHEQLEDFFEGIYKESGLFDLYKEEESCEENVREVQSQLMMFEPPEEEMSLYIGGTEDEMSADDRNLISKFVGSIGLYETSVEKEAESQDTDEGKVALSTIHGSKGLEWPVVFIPGLSDKLFPSRFALGFDEDIRKDTQTEAINEERRCFYVATTRAKYLLYLSSVIDGGNSNTWGGGYTKVSMFVEGIMDKCDKRSKCFTDARSVRKLYDIRQVGSGPGKDFEVEKYYEGYKQGFKWFLNSNSKLDPLNDFAAKRSFSTSSFNTLSSVDRASLPSLSASITTAKTVLSTKVGDRTVYEARKNLVAKRKQAQPTFGQFKSHRPNTSAKPAPVSKAPSYVYRGPTTNAPKGNRAPAYIPDRKNRT